VRTAKYQEKRREEKRREGNSKRIYTFSYFFLCFCYHFYLQKIFQRTSLKKTKINQIGKKAADQPLRTVSRRSEVRDIGSLSVWLFDICVLSILSTYSDFV